MNRKAISNFLNKNHKKILIIGAIGMGNLLMFRPSLKLLKKQYDEAEITYLVLRKSFDDLVSEDPLVDDVLVMDSKNSHHILGITSLIMKLRKRHFDLVITTFPANRIEYNILAYLSGAPLRLAHQYPRKKIQSLSFLQNTRVPLVMDQHDVVQNLMLLNPLNVPWSNDEIHFEFPIKRDELKEEHFLLKKYIINSDVYVGIHPGSSEDHKMILKRWSKNNFAELIDQITQEFHAKILIFGGPEEKKLKEEIAAQSDNSPVIVEGLNIRQVAEVIQKCKLFISNDSGLMHLSVAVGTKTIGIFGPTDETRTAPYGDPHRAVRSRIACGPCWLLQDVGYRTSCRNERKCLDELSVNQVMETVRDMWG